MKTLPDDILGTIADFLWFQSVSMKNACKQWWNLISGRYLITARTGTGMPFVIDWPPTVPAWMHGTLFWINVSDHGNHPLLIPHTDPPLGLLVRRVTDLTQCIVIGYTHTNPPHPTVLATLDMSQKPSPRILVQAAGRSLAIVATAQEARDWLSTMQSPFVCGPHRLQLYVCVGPVARWISVQKYNPPTCDTPTALAVEIYCADSDDPWTAFSEMQRHWKHFRTLCFSTVDGVVDRPNRFALLRFKTTINALVQST